MKSPRPIAAATAPSVIHLVIWAAMLSAGMALTAAEPQPKTILKTEAFDRDPGWEGHNNRITPKQVFMASASGSRTWTSIWRP